EGARAMTTERVSVSSSGEQGNDHSFVSLSGQAISDDGRFVVFNSVATDFVSVPGREMNVFVHDRVTGSTEIVSVDVAGRPTGKSEEQTISGDGRFVGFYSSGANLVSAPVPAGVGEIYVRDRLTGTTELVSVDSSGTPANAESEHPTL